MNAENAFFRAELASFRFDMPFILTQIRLCRSKLGAILEELEGDSQSPVAFEQFGDCSTSVNVEVERLWEAVKRSR